jgi:hypothetical protein
MGKNGHRFRIGRAGSELLSLRAALQRLRLRNMRLMVKRSSSRLCLAGRLGCATFYSCHLHDGGWNADAQDFT